MKLTVNVEYGTPICIYSMVQTKGKKLTEAEVHHTLMWYNWYAHIQIDV